jgi:hypothetical protein
VKLDVDRRTKLNWILEKWDDVGWIVLAADFCDHGNEPRGLIKCW